jgi:hypothetical protein
VAHSLVAFLIRRNPTAFAAWVADIKAGRVIDRSFEDRFGFSVTSLESVWRKSVRVDDTNS